MSRQETAVGKPTLSPQRMYRRYRRRLEPLIALVLGALLGAIVLIMVR